MSERPDRPRAWRKTTTQSV